MMPFMNFVGWVTRCRVSVAVHDVTTKMRVRADNDSILGHDVIDETAITNTALRQRRSRTDQRLVDRLLNANITRNRNPLSLC